MKKISEDYFIKKDNVDYNPSIESILSDDEKVLWRAKPKKTSFILNAFFKFFFVALIWAAIDISMIVLITVNMKEIPWYIILFLVVFFFFHLLPVWIWVANIITAARRLKLEEYAFTDKRIIIKRGFIGANMQSILYSSITSVNLRIGIIERMCKVGDIYIVANQEKNILEDINNPYFVYEKLQKIANDIKNDILYPNEYRADVNRGYKTSYRPDDDSK